WRNQQEALYTFYLPEGSVVSSASLWVNGKEEPAYLTTKSKADSAYQAIVGRERRDPLLLHWQEGSKVTVRVFPCTPAEERQFKIGITTPLKNENGVLEYENIDFKGPYWNHANEEITIVAEDGLQNMDTPFYFGQSGTAYTYSGKYHSKWSLTFDEVPLAKAPFYFNGKAYRVEPYETQTTSFAPRDIYLDINKAWTKKELMVIWGKVKKQKVWVYANNRMQAVTESNIKPLFHHLKNNNFTLFPFHKIGHPQSALVISKYHQMTPTISDIGKSKFAKRISDFLGELDEPIKVFNLGEEQSQYLKTLKEIRSIQLESGLVQDLADLLDQKSFIRNQEDEATVVNQYSGLKIQKVSSPGNQVSKAPDHLMRLFVYNDILKQLGKDYFNKKKNSESLIPMASEAYVVTPISSLIVLETQEDYDRFNIKKSKNSLNNAAILDSGAVPEPHEWLLIILVMLLTLYFYTKQLS
ncbi:MAG: XrtN system VIT domain-containing protein, partial [Bacteroidota bacterium]